MISAGAPIGWLAAVLCAFAAAVAIVRWLHAPREGGKAPALLACFVVLGVALDVALVYAAVNGHALTRYRLTYAGLALGPLIFTAGYTAAMSRRYRHAPQGAALLWLGALCGVLLFLVISRGRG